MLRRASHGFLIPAKALPGTLPLWHWSECKKDSERALKNKFSRPLARKMESRLTYFCGLASLSSLTKGSTGQAYLKRRLFLSAASSYLIRFATLSFLFRFPRPATGMTYLGTTRWLPIRARPITHQGLLSPPSFPEDPFLH
jgi:hypothetical protein